MEFTPEQQAAIDKQIQDAVNNATAGLVSKKTELEAKIAKKNQTLADIESQKAADLEKAEQSKLESEGKLNELIDRLRTQLADQKTENDKLVQKLNDDKKKLDVSLRELIVDNELTKQFMAAGVDEPDLLEAAVALHQNKVDVVEEDGKMVAVLEGGSISDYVAKWKDGKGKAFITAGSSGGGGKDNDQGGTDEYEIYFKPETRNLTKQNELRNLDAERYATLREKYNKVDTRLSVHQ